MASSGHGLLSPASSTVSSSFSGIQHARSLPLSRARPLKPGSQKEIALINYVDGRVLRITRRYAKKFSNSGNDKDDTKGYENFAEVVQDLDAVFDVVWISGTRMLQVPYLLSLGGLLYSYMPAFPFSPSMFRLIKKLDDAFAFLLRPVEHQTESNTLNQVSTTDKVRIKSLVEETRVVAIEVATEGGRPPELEESDGDEEMFASTGQDSEEAETESSMRLSRIYTQTIEILGDSLVSVAIA